MVIKGSVTDLGSPPRQRKSIADMPSGPTAAADRLPAA
jgi:hypothetical protein